MYGAQARDTFVAFGLPVRTLQNFLPIGKLNRPAARGKAASESAKERGRWRRFTRRFRLMVPLLRFRPS